MRALLLWTFGLSLLSADSANSATVTVHWSTTERLGGFGSSPLGAGTSADGDGALLQLGYFSNGTQAFPFAGHWIVLATGSVGDQGVDRAGFFSITTILSAGSFVEPAVGTPLGVRFYDGTTIGTSIFYNTAANIDGSGLWIPPGDPSPIIALTLAKEPTVTEDGVGWFRTAIPVPEPGSVALCCMAAGLFFRRGRPRRML